MHSRNYALSSAASTLVLCYAAGCSNPESPQIPLSSITSTSGQGGLQLATAGYREQGDERVYVSDFGAALHGMLDATRYYGASNIFLVEAPASVADAIRASSRPFTGGCSADYAIPLNTANAPRGNYWLFVNLGIAGSSPTRWIVDDVTMSNRRVRFSYHEHELSMSTCDVHRYFYWVPLGQLEPGTYKLELYNTAKQLPTLMRHVTILPPREHRGRRPIRH